jgi:GT2 family glycosyltransferase
MRMLRSFFSGNAKAARLAKEIEILRKSPLLDPVWYRQTYIDLRDTPIDVARHYLEHGADERRNPHPLFDTSFYLEQNPDVVASGMNPLVHYILYGAAEGRKPNAFSDPASNAEVGANDVNPSEHLADVVPSSAPLVGAESDYTFRDLVISSGLFDGRWYLERYPDVGAAKWDPLEHFIIHGAAEFRDPNPIFDGEYYANRHPTYHTVCASPFEHYLRVSKSSGHEISTNVYTRWQRRYDVLHFEDVKSISSHLSTLHLKPLRILHVFDEAACKWASAIINSWKSLLHSDWSATIYFSVGVSDAEKSSVIELARKEHNIVAVSRILPATFDISEEDYFLLLFGPVLLREHSTYMLLQSATRLSVDAVYCDHDHVVGSGDYVDPVFKPRFSPEYLRNSCYIGPCILLRGRLLSKLNLKNLDAILLDEPARTIVELLSKAQRDKVAHVPFVLYHLSVPFSSATVQRPSLERHWPTVTVIIPTRDKIDFLRPCVESLILKTEYPRDRWTILIVDNNSIQPDTKVYLDSVAREKNVSVIFDDMLFNFSKLNNLAAANSGDSILVFLNNDTTLVAGDWLKVMVEHCLQPDVGAVGAKLLFEDGSVQHGGTVVGGASGMVEHLLSGMNPQSVAPTDFTRELSAVTGACLAISRQVFESIGGFDPILQIAFGDVALCLTCLKKGYRNIYVAKTLFYHFESKTRGYDDTSEKVDKFYREASYTRERFKEFFQNDPYYSPNLSVQRSGEIAFPPRVAKPWLSFGAARKKILMLSVIHDLGYGVPVVLQLQAAVFIERGWDVFVGGPRGRNELAYPGCHRVYLSAPEKAVSFAFENNIDCVVAHTPPFFSVTRWIGPHIPVFFYDYGEPNPEFFADPTYLKGILREKRFCAPLAAGIFAISETVKSQSLNKNAKVVGLGNSHLGVWSEKMKAIREKGRAARNWNGKFVILNVCRFAKIERSYKGLDKYIEIMVEFPYMFPELSEAVVFALAGNSSPEDVVEMEARGLQVMPNVSNEELLELYACVDLYMNFSKWEGYNLGIGQALAMGLPVIASDIEAHREFPIFTSNSVQNVLKKVSEIVLSADVDSNSRTATIFDWKPKLEEFVDEVETNLRIRSAASRNGEPRHPPFSSDRSLQHFSPQ